MSAAVVVSLLLLSAAVAGAQNGGRCLLKPPTNGSRNVYCDDAPYEIDLSYVATGRLTRLDVSRNNLTGLRLVAVDDQRNVTVRTVDASGNRVRDACHVVVGDRVAVDAIVLSSNRVRNLSVCWASVTNLTLSRNRIEVLSRLDTVNGSALRVLDLAYNAILWIENDTFAGTPALQWLDLSSNSLAQLSERTLPGAALRYLDVSGNCNVRSTAAAFQPFENLVELRVARDARLAPAVVPGPGVRLRTLDASRTDLTRVPVAPAPLLGVLLLAGNAIAAVNGGDLDGYPLLRVLDMADNRLAAVEDDAFGRLDMLAALDLSGNRLQTVPAMLPASLRTLDLSRNRIWTVGAGDFAGCPRLTALSVRSNGVRHIADSALAPVQRLDTLDLSDNPIALITREMLAGPARLKTLRLNDVPAPDTSEFPFIDTQHLSRLQLARSSRLATVLLNDTAVLASMLQLEHLDLTGSAVVSLPDRLPYRMPKMRALLVDSVPCADYGPSSWLGDWLCDIRATGEAADAAAVAAEPTSGPSDDLKLTTGQPANRSAGISGGHGGRSTDGHGVRCVEAGGRTARLVLDEQRCAAIARTTAVAAERPAAVAARLRAPATPADAGPASIPVSRTAGRLGWPVAFACVATTSALLLLLLLAVSIVVGATFGGARSALARRWWWLWRRHRRQSVRQADADYQSMEIKSLEISDRVTQRW